VIVAGLQSKSERVACGGAGCAQGFGFELLGEESIGFALIDQDRQALAGRGDQLHRIPCRPLRLVGTEIAGEGLLTPWAVHRVGDRRKGGH
jgi:hypothetical protein